MQSKASTVKEYLSSLPADRRKAIETVRAVILDNLDLGFEEGMQYGMIGYSVPHSIYPAGYHCDPRQPLPFAALASQKNYMAVYIMSLYEGSEDGDWFRGAWERAGKRLDMGKCCIRFRTLDDVPLDVLGEAVKRSTVKGIIAMYEGARAENEKRKAGAKKTARPKPGAKRAGAGRGPKKSAKKTGKKSAKKSRARAR